MKTLIVALLVAAVPAAASAAQRPQRATGTQIACTKMGCVSVPPGCGQVRGMTRRGNPSGYDIIVCPR